MFLPTIMSYGIQSKWWLGIHKTKLTERKENTEGRLKLVSQKNRQKRQT